MAETEVTAIRSFRSEVGNFADCADVRESSDLREDATVIAIKSVSPCEKLSRGEKS